MATATRVKMKTASNTSASQPASSPAPAKPDGLAVWLPRLIVPLGSSLLLWMSFFPLSWGFLAWFALVPLLCLVRHESSGKRVFGLSYLAGLAFFLPILQWLRVADWRMNIAWGLLTIYCSLYFPVAVLLIRRLDRMRKLPLWLAVPAVWVGLEYVRSFALTGFAWYYLGHSQHQYLQVIQVADLGGVYLVSFLIAAVNAWIFSALYCWPGFRRVFRQKEPEFDASGYRLTRAFLGIGFLLLAAGVVGALAYGEHRLSEDKFTAGPRVALLQGNVSQGLRNLEAVPGNSINEQNKVLKYLSFDRARKNIPLMADLAIWPETSYVANGPGGNLGTWVENNPSLPAHKMSLEYKNTEIMWGKVFIPELLRDSPTNHLLGINSVIYDNEGKINSYNSAVFIGADGKRLGRYDKIHRVPFGEFVPFKDWLPFLKWIAPYDWDYSVKAGTRQQRFLLESKSSLSKVPFARFGVLICYEDTNPVLARRYVQEGEEGLPVDFLVNISNDGWFEGTSEHEEHLAICRFRAVETRRAVVRSVNMGISAVIDGNGRVRKPVEEKLENWEELQKNKMTSRLWVVKDKQGEFPDLPVSEWHQFKGVDGVLHATVPIDTRVSLYALYGDWLPGLCWALIGGLLVYAYVRRRWGTALAA